MRGIQSIEDKILDRALFLIGKNRTLDVSIRAISKEAKVNVSAINYYFRSKEEMLKQAREYYLENLQSILRLMEDELLSNEDKLINASNDIIEYIQRYPGITVLFRDALIHKETDSLSKSIFAATENLHSKVQQLLEIQTQNSILPSNQKMAIFMASITQPMENEDIMPYSIGIAQTKELRIEYIKNLLRILQ